MSAHNQFNQNSEANDDDSVAPIAPKMSFEEMEFRAERLYNGICKTFRTLRLKGKLSQRELAEKSGIGQGYICDIEKGRGNPTWEALSALCRALDTNLAALILQTVLGGGGGTPEERTQTSELATLIQELSGSDPSQASSEKPTNEPTKPSRRTR